MKLQSINRYEAYKDSGVEWLGDVPAHWDVRRLKELSDIQNSNVDKKSHEDETPVQLCNYVDVYKNEFINVSLNFMSATADASEIKRFTIKKNDVLITKDSETCDDIAIPALATESLDGVLCGYHLAQFRTKNKVLLGAYLFRLFQSKSYGFRFVISAKGITRVGLGQSAIADSLTPVPPLLEQQAIAAYLDTKTAQIDRKIDLLSQKVAQYGKLKQSLINETVTRGLDKTVAMKDSGVEWIGKVPAHWEIKRVKDLSMLQSGNSIVSEQIEEEGLYPVYGGNGLRGYFSKYTNNGDYILIGRQGALCGNINYASGKFWASEHAVVVYLKRIINMKWYGEMLKVMNLNQYSVSAAQPGLAVDRIKRLLLPVPPFSEQQSIATYLDEKTAHIDRIVAAINSQIDKLKELRLTLINDIGTGKIKITNEVV
ncbi:MAG: restriction endonuclease subunit S [Methylobacter sp.]|nr:restriction endonuclease subunit S [Methylobacter sp.]